VLAPPKPPPAGELDLMAGYDLPADVRSADPALEILLSQSNGTRTRRPTASLPQAGRLTAFFLGAPADNPLSLVARHPKVLTSKRRIEEPGARATEMPVHRLSPRVTVEVDVDYRPRRTHEREEIVLEYRGIDWPDKEDSKLGSAQRLRPGVSHHRFEGLDTGGYRLLAFVDDVAVLGAGDNIAFRVAAIDEEGPGPFQAILREMEIYGHILMDGEPVPGEIRRVHSPLTRPKGAAATERYPTDKDLLYHWTFFARRRVIDPDREQPPQKAQRGLFGGDVRACADDGPCRFLEVKEILQEGRLDIEVLAGRELEVTVLDAADSKPLSDASVAVWHGMPNLVIADGETRWDEPDEGQGYFTPQVRTDDIGVARFRVAEDFEARLGIRKEGYEPKRLQLAAGNGPERLAVLLDRVRKPEIPTRITLGHRGGPLAGAFLIALGPDGRPNHSCSFLTDGNGHLDSARECLAGVDLVILDPRALIQKIDGGLVKANSEIAVVPAPPRPVKVHAVNREGHVAPQLPLRLVFPEFSLAQHDIGLSNSMRGNIFFLPWTLANGWAELRGIDPWSADTVFIEIDQPGYIGRASLLEADPDGTIEIQVSATKPPQ
jgi:hypothetical protein